MAVFTGQIRRLVLQYKKWCLINDSSPNSLFAAGTVLPLPSFSGSLEPVLAAQFGLMEQRDADILAEQFGAQLSAASSYTMTAISQPPMALQSTYNLYR